MMAGNSGTVFLVRHGRTAGNQNTYTGWANPQLDAAGAEQAAMLLRTFDGERIDDIYTSPLVRAIETARPLAAVRDLELRVRPQMREINYGDYEGLCKKTVRLKLSTAYRYERMPRGESLFDLYRRVRAFSDELALVLRKGHRIVVVGHSWSNRMLVGCLGDVPFDAIVDAPQYKPGSGSVLEVNGRPPARGVLVARRAPRPTAGDRIDGSCS
jgi:alpha-ribazole phosphatase